MTSRFVNDELLINYRPYRPLSGEMRYFRTPRPYWRDRLLKLRACGLKPSSATCLGNLHERQRGHSTSAASRAFAPPLLWLKALCRPIVARRRRDNPSRRPLTAWQASAKALAAALCRACHKPTEM